MRKPKRRYPKTFGITRLCGYPNCERPSYLRYRQKRGGRMSKRPAVRLFRCSAHPLTTAKRIYP